MVFGISNNNICISLKNHGWLPKFLQKYEHSGIKVFQCDGNDMFDVYKTTAAAFSHSRKQGRPSILVFNNLVRRFGHVATDRQDAYYTAGEIIEKQEFNSLLHACDDAVAVGAATYKGLVEELVQLQQKVEEGFNISVNEPKISDNDALMKSNSAPLSIPTKVAENGYSWGNTRLLSIEPLTVVTSSMVSSDSQSQGKKQRKEAMEPMRKHMTRYFDEVLSTQHDTVYIGMHNFNATCI